MIDLRSISITLGLARVAPEKPECLTACQPHFQTRSKERHMNTEERFWLCVDKTGDCWNWIGRKRDTSKYPRLLAYGVFRVKFKTYSAHRYSWQMHNGPVPKGVCVLHKCDNPGCVRPDHLFLGTQKQNVADMVAKDRTSRGERHPMSKLTDDLVRKIRATKVIPFSRTEGTVAQAKKLGVGLRMFHLVRNGLRWKHVDNQSA